jgi:hypothetical protein
MKDGVELVEVPVAPAPHAWRRFLHGAKTCGAAEDIEFSTGLPVKCRDWRSGRLSW